MSGPIWYMIKGVLTQLSESLHNYSDYLVNAAKGMQEKGANMFMVRSPDEGQSIQTIYPKHVVKPGNCLKIQTISKSSKLRGQ